MRFILVLALLIATSAATHASEALEELRELPSAQAHLVVNNLQQDYVTCAAFFTLTAGAIENQDTNASEIYLQITDDALARALELGSVINMKTEATSARYEFALDEMTRSMDNDYTNFSILTHRHLRLCEGLMKDNNQRLQYWINQLSHN